MSNIFKKEYWGENIALWSRSYFVASVGGILNIENQKSPE